MVRHVILCSEPVELPADLTILEITAGKIDGNGQIDIRPELKVLIKTADFFGNIKIQFSDQLRSLKRFDEDRGQQMAILGVIPTSQGFCRTGLTGQGPDNGLEENLDIVVFQGLFQMGHHIVIDGQMFLKVFVIFPVNRLIVLFDMGTGCFGIIRSGNGADLGIGNNEYACL